MVRGGIPKAEPVDMPVVAALVPRSSRSEGRVMAGAVGAKSDATLDVGCNSVGAPCAAGSVSELMALVFAGEPQSSIKALAAPMSSSSCRTSCDKLEFDRLRGMDVIPPPPSRSRAQRLSTSNPCTSLRLCVLRTGLSEPDSDGEDTSSASFSVSNAVIDFDRRRVPRP